MVYLNRNISFIILFVIIIIIIGIVVAISSDTPYVFNENMVKAVNNTTNSYSGNGISFNYPSNWQHISGNSSSDIVTFQDPTDNLTGVTVSLEYIPSGTDVQNWIINTGSNEQLISTNTITVNGTTAYEAVDKFDDLNSSQIIKSVWVYAYGRDYLVMSLYTPSNSYNGQQTNFNTIIKSFH